MLVPQRFHRVVPVLVVAVLCLFFLSSSRFRDASLLTSLTTHKIPSTSPSPPPPSSPAEPPAAAPPPPKPQAPLPGNNNYKTTTAATTPAPPTDQLRPPPADGQCSPDLDFLKSKDLGLSEKIIYSRRCVVPKYTSEVDRDAVTKLDGPLVANKTSLNLADCAHVKTLPCDILELPVPFPYPTEQTFGHFVFGVATYYDRMIDALPAFDHWLAGSSAPLVAVIVDHDNHDLPFLEFLFAQHNIDLKTVPGDPHLTIDQNHFITLRPTALAIRPETKWVGILDDDTFFPSLHALSAKLDEFDHTKELWLGQLSEDFYSVRSWGIFGYGGAGVFLSVPLAKKLEPFQEQCLDEAALPSGDGMLRDCVYYHSKTKLTLVPGLYQQDMRGDLSGFFEAGLRPLSLHHWKSWYEEPVPKLSQVNRVCGDCFLQRFQFGDDTLLANGYSIALYRKGVEGLNLDWMEATWNQHGPEFDFSIGPLRPALKPEEKRSYRLKDVEWLDDGRFRQIYVHKADTKNMFSDSSKDEVVELLWHPNPA